MPRLLPAFSTVVASMALWACQACSPTAAPSGADSRSGSTPATGAPTAGAPAPGTPTASTPPATARPGDVYTPEANFTYRTDGLRVASFNAEFLFDGEGDEGQADFPWKGNPEAAREHQVRVAEVIRRVNADVLMLIEVENKEVLDALVAGPLAGMGYTAHFVPGNDRFTGQDMGLLSKLPIDATGRTDERAPVPGSPTETYGVSKNLWARLRIGGFATTIVGVHFLAQPDNAARKPQREAQAEVIRRFVATEQGDGREVIVLGDVNDFDDTILDRRGNRPITSVAALLKAGAAGAENDLRNVMGEVPVAERFSNLYDRNRNEVIEEGELGAIDHVFVSPGLYRRIREVRFVHTHDPRTVTDHFPISVTFAR